MSIKVGDIIKVQYEGTLDDGTVFDSSDLHDGEPLIFEVGAGNIIKGFENAVIGKDVAFRSLWRSQPPIYKKSSEV
jgi:peptidylprolyl isomerase